MILSKLLTDVPHEYINGNDVEILNVAHDSRVVKAGTLFICLKGMTVDGHVYIDTAIKMGAAAILVQEMPETMPSHVTVVKVQDTRRAMAIIAANFYNRPAQQLVLIGVTGTNGKTTTTYFIEQLLLAAGKKVGLIGTIAARSNGANINIHFATSTTPDPLELNEIFVQMIRDGVQYVVMEVSSHALALHKMEGLVFEVGVFTNLTQDHLDLHGTMENYALAKAQLFAQSKIAIVNVDDDYYQTMLSLYHGNMAIKYAINHDADVTATDIQHEPHGWVFNLNQNNETMPVHLPAKGLFNIYNTLAAIAACEAVGVDKQHIVRAVSDLSGVPGRIQHVINPYHLDIYVDYAHSPDGIKNILSSVRDITKGQVIILFGCGGDRDRTKRPIMGQLAADMADYVILTSDNPRTENPAAILSEIEAAVKTTTTPYDVYENRRDAIIHGVSVLKPGDALIIAGKGHEDYQIIGTATTHFSDYETAVEAIQMIYGTW